MVNGGLMRGCDMPPVRTTLARVRGRRDDDAVQRRR